MRSKFYKYCSVIHASMKVEAQYRVNIFFNIFAGIIRIIFAYSLWSTIYSTRSVVNGYTFKMMISYYLIVLAIGMIDKTEFMANSISNEGQQGGFSKYLLMPVNVKNYFFATSIGKSIISGFIIVLGVVVLKILYPIEILSCGYRTRVKALVLITFGILVMRELHYVIGILTLKYFNSSVFMMIKENILLLLVGGLVPLNVFPDGVQAIMKIFPFYYMVYYPSHILITDQVESWIFAVVTLAIWYVIFHLLSGIITKKVIGMGYGGIGL